MSESTDQSAPETCEGWYVLHDCYHLRHPVDSRALKRLQALLRAFEDEAGHSACYRVVGQKADLCLLHYRPDTESLERCGQRLQAACHQLLQPAGSYLSVIEASLYEATARAHAVLARRGLNPSQPEWSSALEAEMTTQREQLQQRVFAPIPEQRHLCFYPMSKRRGEQDNWYSLSMDDRRQLMRGHGRLGHQFADQVRQIISGSVGLDDWEWAVDLHADDPLLFKKLVYAMRFDPASARYAEFGPFWTGIRCQAEELPDLFGG